MASNRHMDMGNADPGDDSPNDLEPGSAYAPDPEAQESSTAQDESATDSAGTPLVPISKVLSQLQGEFGDITVSKIRFLESRGLVAPHRAPSGFRRYSPEDIDRLRWVLTMQRDHFLPLRVIKDRLDSGETHAAAQPAPDSESPSGGVAKATKSSRPRPLRSSSSRFKGNGPEADLLSEADLARLAEVSGEQVAELIRFGLIEPIEPGDDPRYTRVELAVVKAAAVFLRHGIEARHLKGWRLAAEREATTIGQVVVPLNPQSSDEALTRAREVADDLIDHGNAIREATIVRLLRSSLGSLEE